MLAAPEGYEWLQATLKADVTLQAALGVPARVYQRNPPDGAPTYPFILIRYVVATPLMALGAIDIWSDALFDVLVVSKDNSTVLMKPIANRIDEVLNRRSGTTTDATIFFCSKAEGYAEIASTDPPPANGGGGARIQNLGRTWKLVVQ